MGGKGSAPKPPDLSQLAQASVESAEIWAKVQNDQLEWAKQQGRDGQRILDEVMGVQLPQMQEAFRQAQMDRQRYEDTYLPIEQNLVKEFEEYDSPERREQESARMQADVAAQFDSQRENALQRLEGYGIDPSQTRSMAMDRGIRAQQAAMQAMAGNQGRQQVEQMGRALRGEAINIGRGLPSQVGMTQGVVNQTAGGATGNFGNMVSAMGNAYNPAMAAGGMAMQGYQQGADINTQGFQNSLNQWNANAAANQASWNTAINAAGAAGGMFLSDPDKKEKRRPARRGAADAIAAIPVEEYEYRDNSGYDDGQRHMGPMADKVRQELGIGDGTAIPAQDLVMAQFAAIQELTDRLAALEEGIPMGGQPQPNYAIPSDVLMYKGVEHFEKLIDKVRTGGRGGRKENTTADPARRA